MVAFAGIIFNGLFDKYPKLRIGFMEAGVSWLQTCLERFDRGWETHIQYDPRTEYIQLKPAEKISDYIRRHVEAGRIFVGCEGTEKSLHHVIEAVGNKALCSPAIFPMKSTTSTPSIKSRRSSKTSILANDENTRCCTVTPSASMGRSLWVKT